LPPEAVVECAYVSVIAINGIIRADAVDAGVKGARIRVIAYYRLVETGISETNIIRACVAVIAVFKLVDTVSIIVAGVGCAGVRIPAIFR